MQKGTQDKIWGNVVDVFDNSAIPSMIENIKIPVVSPEYDKEFFTNGLIDESLAFTQKWIESMNIAGLTAKVIKSENEPSVPCLYVTIEAFKKTENVKNILMYGHLDRMPVEKEKWTVTDPYVVKIVDDNMYGRGVCDDLIAIYSYIIQIQTLQKLGLKHDNVHILMEVEEESESENLIPIIKSLNLPEIDLVVILDSGCLDYERLWITTSLRGIVNGELEVSVLKSGVHSGDGTGIIPSSFRILRSLLSRVEDVETGKVLLNELQINIPEKRIEQVKKLSELLGKGVYDHFPWINPNLSKPSTENVHKLLLQRGFMSGIEITGCEGIPNFERSSNQLRAQTLVKVSCRLPPSIDWNVAGEALKKEFERDPPYGAKIEYNFKGANGWMAQDEGEELLQSMENSSQKFFGNGVMMMNEGGSIPLVNDLQKMFKKAKFIVTGVEGPGCSCHGPDELLNLPCARKVTACLTQIISEFANY
ncbi:hypothetical protein M0813_19795 [Anaeramoeba flamelloides]|uniref:Peptidase M20 dimerisation domain-containing protein n=1 Tax=Anaeramoeba flamelloides TaxID=1746091 RepID=A0AAV8A6Q8_9EUKA|nr:hypothetical protein M0812_05445 [Anaeramoeba flamelloides]KAJ6246035.1 hypothetical protein M0813_19795 [Anaeramoeba flamelloides]